MKRKAYREQDNSFDRDDVQPFPKRPKLKDWRDWPSYAATHAQGQSLLPPMPASPAKIGSATVKVILRVYEKSSKLRHDIKFVLKLRSAQILLHRYNCFTDNVNNGRDIVKLDVKKGNREIFVDFRPGADD